MDNNIDKKTSDAAPTERRRPHLWQRIVKRFLISAGAILLLVTAAVGVAVWMLSPEELTPMVSRYSSHYLNADVSAEKVELKFWSTFPKVSLDVENLTVVSKSLEQIPDSVRSRLPENADTLLTVKRFSGGINIWAMIGGTVMLYDVSLEQPEANIVMVNDSVANYLIVPPDESQTEPSAMPRIAINRFSLIGDAPVRYYSLSDTMDVRMRLVSTNLTGAKAPQYTFEVAGNGGGELFSGFVLPDVPFSINGRVDWDQRAPKQLEISNLTVCANDVCVSISSALDFENDFTIKSLKAEAASVDVNKVIALLPESMTGQLSRLETDIVADLSASLASPYSLLSSTLPDINISLSVPDGFVTFDRIHINSLTADVNAFVSGSSPDASTISINRFSVKGRSIDFSISAKCSHIASDPAISGEFHGKLNLNTLPAALWDRLQCSAKGVMSGDAYVNMRASDLSAKGFHNLKASGQLRLHDFAFLTADTTLAFDAKSMKMAFGTDAKITIADSLRADSLLKISLESDSLRFKGEGIALAATGANFVIAARNTASSLDTTKINPLGMALRAKRLYVHTDSDSVRLSLRDAAVTASLLRFNGAARQPQLNLMVSTGRARYSDAVNRVALTDARASISVHPTVRRTARLDSVSRARFARRLHTLDSISAASGKENLDFEVDRSVSALLRKWKATGNIKAKRGRLVTPYFPVRNTLRNLDMTFSTDSVVIRNTRYTLGSSDFLVNGSISNISRALTSRRGSPLKINFDITCDTVNINEIYQASVNGSAFAEKLKSGELVIASGIEDDKLQAALDSQSNSYDQPALVIPSNIDAQLNIRAKEVLYADIWLQRLKGNVGIKDGAIHLNELAGYTPIGSLNFTALYSAPTKHDVNFAAGAVVRSLRLKEFLHLLPEIDSVLPLLREVDGIITAEMAMSTEIDSMMNLKFNTLNLVLKLSGDSLVLLDSDTFRKMAKWLMFKHKNKNIINSMKVELMIKDTKLDVFPFVFDIDRYRIGVSGHNTLDMDLDYHVAVLKSPLPFKFGINIKGTPDHMKIRLGKANFDENRIAFSRQLTDTLRMNLVHEIKEVFQFGVRNGKRTKLMIDSPKPNASEFMISDTLTHADSVILIQGGAIDGPPEPPFPLTQPADKKTKKKR